jgi:UDP-N-acetylmuramyl tripeptide synthase
MEAPHLQQAMRQAVKAGFTHLALEASSIGLKEGRLTGTQIEVAVLTNLTQDHLDYHGDMQSYWQAKKILFTQMQPKAVVINLDDAHGLALYLELVLASQNPPLQPSQPHPSHPSHPTIVAYTADEALLPAVLQALTARGLHVATAEKLMQEVVCAQRMEPVGTLGAWGFELAWRGEHTGFELHVLGRYNVSNALAVISTLLALGVPWADALAGCEGLQAVNGRMQRLGLEGTPNVVIDYAHTPDALTQVLSSLQEITRPQGAKLWCVMGCGGDRDRSKRALMGQAAQRWADQVVLTSDNPRSENPASIMDDIERGMSGAAVERQIDRRRAIEWAVSSAALQDWVLVAGKGHETTQEVAGVRLAFSDADVVAQVLVQERAHRQAARGGLHA